MCYGVTTRSGLGCPRPWGGCGVAVGWLLWRGSGSVCAAAGRALLLSLHCSLLQGKEACEETALGVVKETKSEGEEGPSRGEATEQVSICTSPSLPPLGSGAAPAQLQPQHPGVGMGLCTCTGAGLVPPLVLKGWRSCWDEIPWGLLSHGAVPGVEGSRVLQAVPSPLLAQW